MQKKHVKQSLTAAVIVILFAAMVIGMVLALSTNNDPIKQARQIYLFSALIIILSLIAFALNFEDRKPKARELVIISVLSALAVASRAAFYMVPQFKPVAAIVIISGVCFGSGAGFMVGTVSAFVSNFIFGQGLHTPFQMIAFGIIGALAGLLFKDGRLPTKKAIICIYGGLSTLFIYGFILNLQSALIIVGEFNIKLMLPIFVAGLPFDLIHAISTVFFLILFSDILFKKLNRVKKKYGLLE